MIPNSGALAALGLLSIIGYLFWRGTVVVMNARRLVDKGALLLDAGTPAQFSAAHIAGAVNIPSPDVLRRQEEIGPLTQPIVVYARSGFQSARTAQALRSVGYHSVTNVGPMRRWDVAWSKRWQGDGLPTLVGDFRAYSGSPLTRNERGFLSAANRVNGGDHDRTVLAGLA
jgi:rhodanese-related sulfurtransferase